MAPNHNAHKVVYNTFAIHNSQLIKLQVHIPLYSQKLQIPNSYILTVTITQQLNYLIVYNTTAIRNCLQNIRLTLHPYTRNNKFQPCSSYLIARQPSELHTFNQQFTVHLFYPYNRKIVHYKYHSRHICSTNIVAFMIPLTKIHPYLQSAGAHTPPAFELLLRSVPIVTHKQIHNYLIQIELLKQR